MCIRDSLVTGEAGAGKSRLLREFRRSRVSPGASARVWSARGDPMRPGSAYTILSQLLRQVTGVPAHDASPRARTRFVARVRAIVDGEAGALAADFLAEATGLGGEEASEALRAART